MTFSTPLLCVAVESVNSMSLTREFTERQLCDVGRQLIISRLDRTTKTKQKMSTKSVTFIGELFEILDKPAYCATQMIVSMCTFQVLRIH